MSFSPVCRWVGWRHYIQYRPSRHHRSQPHTSPLASGTPARTRWCTGFIQEEQNREQHSETRWKIQRKAEQVTTNASGSVNSNKSVDMQSARNLQRVCTYDQISHSEAKQSFFRQTSNAPGHFASSASHFFPSFLLSGGTKPGTLSRLAASDETRSNSVWRHLQLPFGCASLNHFKYTLTCAHPLTGGWGTEEGGHENSWHFFSPWRLTIET